jgi:hypothetical protein
MRPVLAATVFIALSVSTVPALADLTGTTVTGGLFFGGGSANYFDPAYGFVPAGYGNVASIAVTVGAGIEFAYNDGANFDTADFTGSSLTVTDVDTLGANFFEMIFIDPALTRVTQTSGSADGFTFFFSGDELDIFYPGSFDSGTFAATFSLGSSSSPPPPPPSSTPEPSSLALLGTGAFAVASVLRRRVFSRC